MPTDGDTKNDATGQDVAAGRATDATDDDGAGSTDDVSGLKSALQRERDRAKAAEKRAGELEAAERQRAAEKQKADEKAAAERGEYQELATKREQERDTAQGEVTSLKAENDRLRAAIDAVLKDEWKALPSEVRDAYLGADDDPLAKMAFLPKGRTLADKLAEKAPAARGNGADPPAGGATGATVEQETRALAARGGYSM